MHLHSSIRALSFILAATVCATAQAQTDVALSVYGTFSTTANYNIGEEHQHPAATAGGLLELRHIRNPFVGYEVAYSFNRANQVFTYTGPLPVCPGICTTPTSAISANAHELTGDWLVSVHAANFRPFALMGAGLLFNEPSGNPSNVGTQSATEPVYVYGAGVDWGLLPHLGLRIQYRGNIYKAPQISTGNAANVFVHTAEPAAGVYFRF